MKNISPRKPDYLKVSLPTDENYFTINKTLRDLNINTVCTHAKCPNIFECWQRRHLTFMILGSHCTRRCAFCSVETKKPHESSIVDEKELETIPNLVAELKLNHVVITSVTRDDLPDDGAGHFVKLVENIRAILPTITIELLIPDFKESSLERIIEVKPTVLAHNMETVSRLYKKIRPKTRYEYSLSLLQSIKKHDREIISKAGFMLGIGETESEVHTLLQDIHSSAVDIVTIGQYLQPTLQNAPVTRYYKPEEFLAFKNYAHSIGIKNVESGPFVRSSYYSENTLHNIQK